MLPIERLTPEEAASLQGLLFDLDDTLLDGGKLSEAAYSSLFRLREAGLGLAVVTGRPASWGDFLVRQWPIDGAVTENGAILLVKEQRGHLDRATDEERQERSRRLAGLVTEIKAQFPELRSTSDARHRISDFSFDIGEWERPGVEVIERAIAFARAQGAKTIRSSVHLHVTLEEDDKASGALRLIAEIAGLDRLRAQSSWAFIGDSENDAACFAAFHTTIGVSNLSGELAVPPRFITQGPRGAGFAEAAAVLVDRRRNR
ncbi:MAG TPA: HAD-IIB family hydrolase [Polyangiaceae bacterium]